MFLFIPPTSRRPHVFAAALLCAIFAGCHHADKTNSASADQPLAVHVRTLHAQSVNIVSDLPGRLSAVRTAEVRPQVGGILLRRLFTEGATVKAGQQLYQIDPAPYQATYDKAVASLSSAHALVTRYAPLVDSHAVSRQQYDDAVAAEQEAKADVESARINLRYTRVDAPISGHTSRSLLTEGALVTSGQSSYLTTIQQLDPIYVDVTESSIDLLRLRAAIRSGQLQNATASSAEVKLTLEDGSTYSHNGTLQLTEVSVDKGTGSVVLRASFPNPGSELLPGMFVHAQLVEGVRTSGILVPQAAVMRDVKGNPYVYVVGADHKVANRPIVTTRTMGESWLVDSGLQDGDQVLIDGLQKVGQGTRVNPQEENAAAPAARKNASMTDPSAQ